MHTNEKTTFSSGGGYSGVSVGNNISTEEQKDGFIPRTLKDIQESEKNKKSRLIAKRVKDNTHTEEIMDMNKIAVILQAKQLEANNEKRNEGVVSQVSKKAKITKNTANATLSVTVQMEETVITK